MHVTTVDLESMLTSQRETATAQWAGWAAQLADGGDAPPAEAVLVAAASLGIPMPGEALAADARALNEMRTLEEKLAGREAWRSERLAPWGGSPRRLQEEILAVRATLDRLERLSRSCGWDTRAATLKRQMIELKAKHPRVFPEAGAAAPAPSEAARPRGAAGKGRARKPAAT